MSLKWQSEEEFESGKPPAATLLSRRWSGLIVAFLLVAAMLVLWWLITQQAKVGTQQVESDLLASYEVTANAARDHDAELFVYFLSGKEPKWTSAWEQVVAEGAYLERPLFGLTWLPETDPLTAVTDITLNAQFNAAELVTEQTYSFEVGNGLTETVRLLHTAVFRLGPNRWLLAPPEETFWGAEQVITSAHLSLQVPERDQAIADRLVADLNDILAAMCTSPSFSCPPDYKLNVIFKTDPASLSPNYRSMIYVAGSWSTRFPTPTLIGLPQDEAGYQALLRGYGVQLVNPVMLRLNGMHAGMHTPFLDAWMDWQLRALGLRPYPLQTADWHHLAQQATPLSAGRELFVTNGPATPFTYAVIEFLIGEMRVPPETFMQSFTSGPISTYEEWLVSLTGDQYGFADLEERWQAFIRTRADTTPER
jgi:hypothetical protein